MSTPGGPSDPGPSRPDRQGVIVAALFFLLYTLAVAGPGLLPFNRIRPLVLGLPFSMAWIVGWVLAAGAVLVWLEARQER